MRRLGLLFTCAVVLTAALWASSARAAPSARLMYVRGPGAERCPGEPAVRAAVAARLGYDPFFDWAREVVLVEIVRPGRTFRVLVERVDDAGRQRGAREISVRGDDCSAAIDAAGLSVSLIIDAAASPAGAARPPAAAGSPPSTPPVSAAPPAAAPPALVVASPAAPAPSQEREPPLSLRLGLGALGSVNAAPSPAAGATLFVGIRRRALSLDLEGRADAPTTGDSGAPPVQVRAWLVAASLLPCTHLGAGYGCAVLSAGRLDATAPHVAAPADRHGPWSAAGARLGAEWVLATRVALQFYGQLLAVLTRDKFFVDGAEVYAVPAWSAAAGVALAWRLW